MAWMMPLRLARTISAGSVWSVRYRLSSGSKRSFGGTADRILSRYASACSVVVIGGLRLGITSARAKRWVVWGSTDRSSAPSLRCRCQSSGRASVSVFIGLPGLSRVGPAQRSDGGPCAGDIGSIVRRGGRP